MHRRKDYNSFDTRDGDFFLSVTHQERHDCCLVQYHLEVVFMLVFKVSGISLFMLEAGQTYFPKEKKGPQ